MCQNPGKSPFVSYCENNNSLVVRLNAAHESPAVINQPLAQPNRIRSRLKDGFIYPKVATTTCVTIIDGEMRFPSGLTRLNLRQRLSLNDSGSCPRRFLLNQILAVPVSGLCLNTEYKRSLCSILKLICHQPNSNPSPLQREIAYRATSLIMKTDWWGEKLFGGDG